MKKYKVIGHYDFLVGHLRTGYDKVELSEKELEHFKSLSEEEQIDYIQECGEAVCDDYEIDDYGDIIEIEILEI